MTSEPFILLASDSVIENILLLEYTVASQPAVSCGMLSEARAAHWAALPSRSCILP